MPTQRQAPVIPTIPQKDKPEVKPELKETVPVSVQKEETDEQKKNEYVYTLTEEQLKKFYALPWNELLYPKYMITADNVLENAKKLNKVQSIILPLIYGKYTTDPIYVFLRDSVRAYGLKTQSRPALIQVYNLAKPGQPDDWRTKAIFVPRKQQVDINGKKVENKDGSPKMVFTKRLIDEQQIESVKAQIERARNNPEEYTVSVNTPGVVSFYPYNATPIILTPEQMNEIRLTGYVAEPVKYKEFAVEGQEPVEHEVIFEACPYDQNILISTPVDMIYKALEKEQVFKFYGCDVPLSDKNKAEFAKGHWQTLKYTDKTGAEKFVTVKYSPFQGKLVCAKSLDYAMRQEQKEKQALSQSQTQTRTQTRTQTQSQVQTESETRTRGTRLG